MSHATGLPGPQPSHAVTTVESAGLDAERQAPHTPPPADDPEAQLPPPRQLAPGAAREVALHWLLTIGGFTALLLIGRYFSG